ncbi:integrase arm-type DNA-binding domain-containing protein [uncultured Castellaniella sp.]|uniref:tyrosine-type recombinase/integrase n=1 Tax=uncultured Castellaniella sp. TaxID=647907 RepID=UPI00260CA5D2|nr:integrase arm-type DNA-binding domain-containing protein [uncultured Castellaniella sp.]
MTQNLLSTRTIDSAKAAGKPYHLRDGGSLFLSIQPSGSKLWRYRYRLDGRAQVYAIGRYPDITLAQARQERDRARDLIRQGIHPLSEQSADQNVAASAPPSFEAVTRAWLAANPQWSPSYSRQIRRYFEKDILPAIGDAAVADLTPADIRELISSIAERGARCAALLTQQWISQVFSHAIVQGQREDNPASLLKGLVKRAAVRHHPPLGWSDIPGFFQRLDAWDGYSDIAIGLRLLALTFVRPSELRLARWQEFDFDNAIWTVPKERMKMRRPHMVPLAQQTVTLLRSLRTKSCSNSMLFPNHRDTDRELAASSFNHAIERLGYGGRFSAHGFRATATTLLGLLGYPDKLVDLQLAHRRRDTSRAPYDHARFVGSRTLLMQDWADILEALADGNRYAQLSQMFGPLSERRTMMLAVIERE